MFGIVLAHTVMWNGSDAGDDYVDEHTALQLCMSICVVMFILNLQLVAVGWMDVSSVWRVRSGLAPLVSSITQAFILHEHSKQRLHIPVLYVRCGTGCAPWASGPSDYVFVFVFCFFFWSRFDCVPSLSLPLAPRTTFDYTNWPTTSRATNGPIRHIPVVHTPLDSYLHMFMFKTNTTTTTTEPKKKLIM